MVRLVQVQIPNEETAKIESEILKMPYVYGIGIYPGKYTTMYTFRIKQKKMQGVWDALEELGVGEDFGNIDIIPLTVTKPRLPKTSTKRVSHPNNFNT